MKHFGSTTSKPIKILVVDWWTLETTISPNSKDNVRRQIRVKVYEEHAKHFLQVP
jgi:hypothetical protein